MRYSVKDHWVIEDEKDYLTGYSRYASYDGWLKFMRGYLCGLNLRHLDFDGNPITQGFKLPIIHHLCSITEGKYERQEVQSQELQS